MIEIQSPTRVDLAGGTLDMWPLYDFVGSAKTINLAISVFTSVKIIPRVDGKIILRSLDLQSTKAYQSVAECLKDEDKTWSLLLAQIQYWQPTQGFELETKSDSPVGGGLGGSSSLTISLLKAFSKWLNRPFANVHKMVDVAHHIEAKILRTPTGTQDYYPAVSGGLNILGYSANGITQEFAMTEGADFDSRFLLVYTGKAHHSGLNNFEVLKKAVEGDQQTLQALTDIKKVADELEAAILEKRWNDLGPLFKREYLARVNLCEAFSSPEIENLEKISMKANAEAIKICGAGGGGCVMIWCGPNNKQEISEACRNAGYQVMNAKLVSRLD